MNRFAISILLIAALLAAASAFAAERVEIAELTETAVPTATPGILEVGEISAENLPTPTPEPSRTPAPTVVPEGYLDDEMDDVGEIGPAQSVRLIEKSAERADLVFSPAAVPEGGLPIPCVWQFESKTPFCRVNGRARSVSTSGCGAVCVSEVIYYVTGEIYQTPYTLMREAAETGRYDGHGLLYTTMSELLAEYGVANEITQMNREAILEALEADQPVIILMGPGTFTRRGHYILLRGIDADGKIFVTDPNSPERSAKTYDVDLIVRQCKDEMMLVVRDKSE